MTAGALNSVAPPRLARPTTHETGVSLGCGVRRRGRFVLGASNEQEVDLGLEPFRQALKLLSTMPGLSSVSAHVVVAEIGINMSRFATPAHLLSWACLCPRNDESAGKRRSTRRRRGGK